MSIITSLPQVLANNGLMCNAQIVGVNLTIPTGYNAMSAGPITVATGVTVTVPTDSTWVIM